MNPTVLFSINRFLSFPFLQILLAAPLKFSTSYERMRDVKLRLKTIGENEGRGPSSGIALVVAIMSWALSTRAEAGNKRAFTGEITRNGVVQAVGNIKAKVMACVASGVTQVFIPQENFKEISYISKSVTSKIKITPVNSAMEVLTQVFPTHFGNKKRKGEPAYKPAKKPKSAK